MDQITNLEKIRKSFYEIKIPNDTKRTDIITHFSSYLEVIEETFEKWDEKKFSRKEEGEKLIAKFTEELPIKSTNLHNLHNLVKNEMIPNFTYENINFFGYIPRDPAPASVIGDALVPFFNQYAASPLVSPVANAIEGQTIKWIGKMLGYRGKFYGSYTIGGSDANTHGIYIGLVNTIPWDYRKQGQHGDKIPTIYTSDQAHICIRKAVKYLGLGQDNLRIIPSDDQFKLNLEKLEGQIKTDLENNYLPLMIVGTAGTTNTGSIDDLSGLAMLARKYKLWFHIDAAYGGFARISDHPVANDFMGMEKADSIAIDTHKWLYTPMEGGIILVKDAKKMELSFDETAEYLVDTELEYSHDILKNFSSYGVPLSRRWRGLMVWFNIKCYGQNGLSQLITRNILVADYLREKINQDPKFILLADTKLSVVCFRIKGDDEINLKVLNEIYKRGKFFISRTKLKGKLTLRVCIVNINTSPNEMDELFDHLNHILQYLESN